MTSAERQHAMFLTALGPHVAAALQDERVTDVMQNPDGRLWVDRHGEGRACLGRVLPAADAERIVRFVASHMRTEAHEGAPVVSAELPGTGERFEGLLPPVVTAPCFAIRRPASVVYTLADYVSGGVMTEDQAYVLQHLVRQRRNVVVVGGTGSGKTTLANALLAEVASRRERVVVIEDTRELRCDAQDVVRLRTKAGVADLTSLVRSTLRLRPDRIVVGEVRGPEALDLLKAWNTGHPGGVATLHASSARGGLTRLEQLCGEAAVNVPSAMIAETVHALCFLKGRGTRRRLDEIVTVQGLTPDGDYDLAPVTGTRPKGERAAA
jgi:type IV secretion system protein VirB11